MTDDTKLDESRRIRFWHTAVVAAIVLGFMGFVVAAGAYNLFGAEPPAPPDRGHDTAPLPSSGELTLQPGPLAITIDGGERRVWQEDDPRLAGGVFTLPWAGDGGALVLRFRADDPAPQRLVHDANLSRANTFNVTWNGAPAAPAEGSHFDFLTQEVIDRRISGRFHLALENATLDGRFPHSEKGFNYRGALSIAFFGGAAAVFVFGWWRRRAAPPK